MKCDMCDSEGQVKAMIEGAELVVCPSCAAFGTIIAKVESNMTGSKAAKQKEGGPVRVTPKRPEIITIINAGYPNLIKQKRERRGLKQEELAQKIGEKTSIIHQLETGSMEPDMSLARKLEKFLKISLVEEYEEAGISTKTSTHEVTIGDVIKVK